MTELLVDAFGRIREVVHDVVSDLDEDQLAHRLDGGQANSIAWLVWHLTRIQDDHIADAAGTGQIWPAWADRFNFPFDPTDTGYAHRSADVARVHAPGNLLLAYLDAVTDRTIEYLHTLAADDLPRIVDRRWDPPVTLAVRLVSVVSDDLQHAGQAAFVKGMIT